MRGALFGLLMLTVMASGDAAAAMEAREIVPATRDTRIAAVMNAPLFNDWGRLLFPANPAYWEGDTLGTLRLTWYSHIRPERTVEIVNHLRGAPQPGSGSFTTSTTKPRRWRIPASATPACSFSGAGRARRRPSRARAAASPMWARCTLNSYY